MARPKRGTEGDSTTNLGFEAKFRLAWFASADGKNGVQFYSPSRVVRPLSEPVPDRMDLAPYKGRIYDPAHCLGVLEVQSRQFVESHAGKHRSSLENVVNLSIT